MFHVLDRQTEFFKVNRSVLLTWFVGFFSSDSLATHSYLKSVSRSLQNYLIC